MLVFVPLSSTQLSEWARTGVLAAGAQSYAVTTSLRESFDVDDSDEAERIALLVASIAALVRHGSRLVAVAEAEPQRIVQDSEFGEVSLGSLRFASVESLFCDEAGLQPDAAAVAGLSLAQAWDHPVVIELLSTADLLWHGVGEWESILAG